MSCLINHHERAEQLLAYCAGGLRAEDAERIALHLRSCSECAAIYSTQVSVWNALDTWKAAPVSHDFDRRLFARIEAEKAATWLARAWDRFITATEDFVRPIFAQPALPLSVAAMVIAAGFVLDHPAKLSPPAATHKSAVSSVTPVEADKVEATLEDMEMLRQFDLVAEDKENTKKSM
jgi:hypothetical protein